MIITWSYLMRQAEIIEERYKHTEDLGYYLPTHFWGKEYLLVLSCCHEVFRDQRSLQVYTCHFCKRSLGLPKIKKKYIYMLSLKVTSLIKKYFSIGIIQIIAYRSDYT